MDPILILLLGLLGCLAIPGLLLIMADQVGPTETHHRAQTGGHAGDCVGTGRLS